jgi:hypothetical protein
MAAAVSKSQNMKQKLLLVFVIISVILVGLIWADGLFTDEPEMPSYYRNTVQVDEPVAVTITPRTHEHQTEATTTPTPDPTPNGVRDATSREDE